MSVPAVYLPEAEDDIADAWRRYEADRPGLGDRFAAAVRSRVEVIRSNPQLFGKFRRDVRAVMLKRFPFVVYYRDRGADVLIVAVQHGKRSVRNWRARLA